MLAWKFNDLNTSIASVRYRGLKPVQVLSRQGTESKLFFGRQYPRWESVDAYINVKSYTFHDLRYVQIAFLKNIPVVLDLCDNIFLDTYTSEKTADPSEIFLAMTEFASAIVTTSEILKSKIAQVVTDGTPIYVIADGIENMSDLEFYKSLVRNTAITNSNQSIKNLLGDGKKAALKKAARYTVNWCKGRLKEWGTPKTGSQNAKALPPKSSTKTILWFGNHGAKHASFGMLDLLQIQEPLEALAKTIDFELVIVSNNRAKFDTKIAQFNIKTRYAEWDAYQIYDWVRRADVVVLPSTPNEFSICKSANRAVLALSQATPVIASTMPIYEPLSETILFDNWEENIRTVLSRTSDIKRQFATSNAKALEKHYSDSVISNQWINLLASVSPAKNVMKKKRLGLFFGLITDVEVLEPLIAVLEDEYEITAFVDLKLAENYPKLWNRIQVDKKWALSTKDEFETNVKDVELMDVLITAAESNLRPHKLAHALTKHASKFDVLTLTLQHGFENIGLTYSDEKQPAESIIFAANHVLTWAKSEHLLPNVVPSTRAKCVPIGCLKQPADLTEKIEFDKPFSKYVGVFENLHWTRYSDEYRDLFLSSFDAAAQKFPDIGFVVKPHQAGQWLTHRYKGDIPNRENVIIIRPDELKWKYVTASRLFGSVSAIITSPSTVAVDSALAQLPTAVAAFDMDLENYSPLTKLKTTDDWHEFIKNIEQSNTSKMITQQQQFLDDQFAPGNPVENFKTFLRVHTPA